MGANVEIRRFLARQRLTLSGAIRFGSRLLAMVEYMWHLIIWSRIEAARLRRKPVKLPPETLARKGVFLPAPSLEASGITESKPFEEGFADIYALLFTNLQTPGLLAETRHARPGPAFRGIYLWDSAFIAQIWSHWEPNVAAEVLLAVVNARDGNRLQHVVADFVQSAYTQPPLLGWSAVRLLPRLKPSERKQFLDAVYPVIRSFHEWLYEHRRHDNGLFFWVHPYESGVENAPRFSNVDETRLTDTRSQSATDLSSYVVVQLEAMEAMASELGMENEAQLWRQEAEQLRKLINDCLWNQNDCLYYDRDLSTGEPIASKTVACLMPLLAGVPNAEQLAALKSWLMRPDGFGTPMPIPSVARCDPDFEKDMWRGPVWINTAYLVVEGLLRYQEEDLAGAIAYRLCQFVHLVHHTERRIYEFYDPELLHTRELRRKRGNVFKAITLGTGPQRDFVGWSGLVNPLLIDVLIGLDHDDNEFRIRPRFPEAAAGSEWSLSLPALDIALRLRCAGRDGYKLDLDLGGSSQSVSLARGATFRTQRFQRPNLANLSRLP